MTNGPFYALLAYMIIRDGRSWLMTRTGLRTMSEKKPPEPKSKAPAPESQNGAAAGAPWPARRTG